MKRRKFARMRFRRWDADEVRELADKAKAKGIAQKELCRFVGCTVAALQYWMDPESGRSPSGTSRRALTLAELCVEMEITPRFEEE